MEAHWHFSTICLLEEIVYDINKLMPFAKTRKKLFPYIFLFSLGISLGAGYRIYKAQAEQSGSSPTNDETSYIKTIYDSLFSLNYGSDSAGSWGDWGSYWNRVRSAGESSANYTAQSLVEWDDYKTGDSEAEESSWSNTFPLAEGKEVWKDSRTDLYWSHSLGQYSNIFPDTTHTACPFFALSDRGEYNGLDADCGNAINACGILSLEVGNGGEAETDWYLPSQKELQQAYIDGMYNQTTSAFTTTSSFWSSTERSNSPASAWYVPLYYGSTSTLTKVAGTGYVRCVRRD